MNAKGITGIGVPRLVGGAQAPTRAQGSAPRPAPASARGPHRAGPGAVWLSEVLSAWSWTRAQIRLWRQRARGRRELAGTNAVMLKDIGIGRVQARHEAAKPFWEA